MTLRTEFHLDESDGRVIVNRVQDVEPIVERAKALHNEGFHRSKDREFVHAASLPNVLVEKYCNLHGITFDEFLGNEEHIRAMCNDPELAYFRVWPGRV